MDINPVYNIPHDCSPVLYYYFQNQNTYDLERLLKQYDAEIRSKPSGSGIQECIDIINDILRKRKDV